MEKNGSKDRAGARCCDAQPSPAVPAGDSKGRTQNIRGFMASSQHLGLSPPSAQALLQVVLEVPGPPLQSALSAVCFPRPAPSHCAEASERRPTATFRLLRRPFPCAAIPWPCMKAGPTMRHCAWREAAAGGAAHPPAPNTFLGIWRMPCTGDAPQILHLCRGNAR